MRVMLLGAAGHPLASPGLNVPQILVDVGGEPLWARQLRYLAREGAGRVVVNGHHLAEQVEDFAAQHTGPSELAVVRETEGRDTIEVDGGDRIVAFLARIPAGDRCICVGR
jgi:NDP-sugar pyrophosphorylase family protein